MSGYNKDTTTQPMCVFLLYKIIFEAILNVFISEDCPVVEIKDRCDAKLDDFAHSLVTLWLHQTFIAMEKLC